MKCCLSAADLCIIMLRENSSFKDKITLTWKCYLHEIAYIVFKISYHM